MKTRNLIVAGWMTLLLSPAMAIQPPIDPNEPGGPGFPVQYKVTGSIVLENCQALASDVRVRLMPGNLSAAASTRTVMADGRIRLTYGIRVAEPMTGTFTVMPSIRAGVCSNGGFTPPSRRIPRVPATGVNFEYTVAAGNEYRIAARDFASTIDLVLNSAKLLLDNTGGQNSFVEVAGRRATFQIPRVTVDIDCGTFCPDLGDGHFYVNDVGLKNASFEWGGQAFELQLLFEDAGREIKGYHSKLGDSGMPDFELNRPKLSLKAQLKATPAGELALAFYGARFDSDIQATGGCSIAGVDICNKIFGTDRKIQKGIENAASQMNNATVQAALSAALRQYLTYRGITGRVIGVRLHGGDLFVSVR